MACTSQAYTEVLGSFNPVACACAAACIHVYSAQLESVVGCGCPLSSPSDTAVGSWRILFRIRLLRSR